MKNFEIKDLEVIKKIKKMHFHEIAFRRGLGLIEDAFLIKYINGSKKIIIEVSMNLRIRDDNKLFVISNDLYINKNGYELSTREYRRQRSIEKTYLHDQLLVINKLLEKSKIYKIVIEAYGDINIIYSNGIIIEIIYDHHLEESLLLRVIERDNVKKELIEYELENFSGKIFFNKENVDWNSIITYEQKLEMYNKIKGLKK